MPASAPIVNTKTAPRRPLRFDSVRDVLGELDRLEAAQRAGTLRATANWSPGQIFQHLARAIRPAYDGFGFTLPMPIRIIGGLLRGRFVTKGFAPGFKNGGKMAELFTPDPGVSFDAGLAEYRAQLARVDSGERMTHPSPGLGAMSHDQWVQLHLRHAELHLGFLDPGGAAATPR